MNLVPPPVQTLAHGEDRVNFFKERKRLIGESGNCEQNIKKDIIPG